MNALISLIFGIVIGGIGAVIYFCYTGSVLNWKKK